MVSQLAAVTGRRHVLASICLLALAQAAPAGGSDPMPVVAIGASNTSGWGVGVAAAYPARLEALLRACGFDVQVSNAGMPFETTNGMLARIDRDVPDGTRAVIIQPGGNDLRFLGSPERRAANVEAMRARLRERSIQAIVYDPVFPPEDYQWDRIHINAAGHERIARELLPRVAAALAPSVSAGRRRATRPEIRARPDCAPAPVR